MKFRNPSNGYVEESSCPWLWCLLFGAFYFMAKGIWFHAILGIALALMTFGLSWLLYPLFANIEVGDGAQSASAAA